MLSTSTGEAEVCWWQSGRGAYTSYGYYTIDGGAVKYITGELRDNVNPCSDVHKEFLI